MKGDTKNIQFDTDQVAYALFFTQTGCRGAMAKKLSSGSVCVGKGTFLSYEAWPKENAEASRGEAGRSQGPAGGSGGIP